MFIKIHQTLKKLTVLTGFTNGETFTFTAGSIQFFNVLSERNKGIINLKTLNLDSIHTEPNVDSLDSQILVGKCKKPTV